MTGATIDYLDESTLDDDLDDMAGRLSSSASADRQVLARTKRVERRIGFDVPLSHRSDLHMAVMYCHEELERRREHEQRISRCDSDSTGNADSARSYTYGSGKGSRQSHDALGSKREYYCEHSIIGVDTVNSGLRPDHAAFGYRSAWLGYHADDYRDNEIGGGW